MHEVALVADLVDAAVSAAGGRPAATVRVRYASTIPDEVLIQAWEMLVADGPLAEAALDAQPFAVTLGCPCGYEGALGHDDVIGPGQAVCPGCAELRSFPPVPELELVEIVPL